MNNYKNKSLADVVRTASSMLLFLIFTVCMLVIIALAANTYSRITQSFDSTFNTSAAVRYISNKIKNADSVELSDGVISAKNGGIVSVIYCGNGGIYEKNISASADIITEGGEKIFDTAYFTVTLSEGLYHIDVTHGGESSSAIIRGR